MNHPLLAQADDFLAALRRLLDSIPEPEQDAGALEDANAGQLERNRNPRKPRGIVIVPGSGTNTGSMDDRGWNGNTTGWGGA